MSDDKKREYDDSSAGQATLNALSGKVLHTS